MRRLHLKPNYHSFRAMSSPNRSTENHMIVENEANMTPPSLDSTPRSNQLSSNIANGGSTPKSSKSGLARMSSGGPIRRRMSAREKMELSEKKRLEKQEKDKKREAERIVREEKKRLEEEQKQARKEQLEVQRLEREKEKEKQRLEREQKQLEKDLVKSKKQQEIE